MCFVLCVFVWQTCTYAFAKRKKSGVTNADLDLPEILKTHPFSMPGHLVEVFVQGEHQYSHSDGLILMNAFSMIDLFSFHQFIPLTRCSPLHPGHPRHAGVFCFAWCGRRSPCGASGRSGGRVNAGPVEFVSPTPGHEGTLFRYASEVWERSGSLECFTSIFDTFYTHW